MPIIKKTEEETIFLSKLKEVSISEQSEKIVNYLSTASYGKEIIHRYLLLMYNYKSFDINLLETEPNELLLGGEFISSIYTELIKKNKLYLHLFGFIPANLQTDEMLKQYVADHTIVDKRLGNYHGESLSTTTIEWIIKNALSLVPQFRPEWWTPKIKQLAIETNRQTIAFMPPDVITRQDCLLLLSSNVNTTNVVQIFWNNISEKLKNDEEIVARVAMSMGGLSNIKRLTNSSNYLTKAVALKYFEIQYKKDSADWLAIKSDWKTPDMIDVALPKVMGAIAVDEEVEPTAELFKKSAEFGIVSPSTEAQMIFRAITHNFLDKQLIDLLQPSYNPGIKNHKEYDKIIENKVVLDYFVGKREVQFIKNKNNWPKSIKMTKEHFIDVAIALNFSIISLESRFMGLGEDDFIWIYLESNKLDDENSQEIKIIIDRLKDSGVIQVSNEVLDLLQSTTTNTTYDDFKSACQIFLLF